MIASSEGVTMKYQLAYQGFWTRVEAAKKRVVELQQPLPVSEKEKLQEALKELQNLLEELQVTQEDLYRRADQLEATC